MRDERRGFDRRNAGLVALLLVATGAGCDGEPPDPDAGLPIDAGDDADAGRDAGSAEDGGPPDAGPDADAGADGGAPVTECTTTIAAADTGSFVELCDIDGTVEHVRIEGILTPRTHASAQVVFGFEAPPASATETLAADQLRVLLYGGGVPFPGPVVQGVFGELEESLEGDASFLHAESTVCFDVHDGAADAPPHFVLWVDGQNGADCDDFATLTAATAFGVRAFWRGAVGAIDKAARLYYRQGAGVTSEPTITLFDEPALDVATIQAAAACTTSWATNTDWQPLCEPTAGSIRHVRVEDIETTANNSYWYVVVGEDPSPTGNPAPSTGKLIVTGGQSHAGMSWTWFRFDDGSTMQLTYPSPTSASPLYTSGPSTICFDLGEDGGNARLLFWATGADGADCADRATLTEANALYDSTTDGTTGDIWDMPLVEGASFVKTNNATVTLGDVVASSEAAAL